MEKPEFVIGNEKKFAEFISNLKEDKLIVVSHTDLDGISSAKIVDSALKTDEALFVNYSELNKTLVDRLKKTKAKKIVFTDLFFKQAEIIKDIEKFASILIIDHHPSDIDLNSDRTVHMNAQGFCAAYICYYLFSKIVNLEKYDWLVASASIADVQYFHNISFLTQTFKKYGDKFEFISDIDIRKSGKFWEYQWNITLALIECDPDFKKVFDSITDLFEVPNNLKTNISKVQAEYDFWKSKFSAYREKIPEGYYWEFTPKYKINSFIINELSFAEPNKTFIFVSYGDDVYKLSMRRQDGNVDLNELSKKLCYGFIGANAGGHKKASGGFFPSKYLLEFKKRLGIK